ncbi:hypothetical protein BJY52DRAFT_1418277 [Lactarius psammicola]|nr:hypothetical protein BJY52DRAFT_1418277 [Lactarius psammicola]
MDAPPPNNDVCVPASFHHAHQTPIENLHVPTTPPDPVAARVMHSGVVTSTTTVPISTLNPLASTPPPTSMVSTSPPDAVADLQTVDCRAPSDDPDVPSLPPTSPVLDNMLPIGLQSFLDSPVTGSDHASLPDSHSSLLDPAAPGPSHPRLSSAPDMGTAAGGEGTAKAALHKERDALDTPSAVRENIMAAPHLPP